MQKQIFSETMLGSKDITKSAKFYTDFLGMEISNPGDESYIILNHPKTSQRLCIVNDPSIVNAKPSVESKDIEGTVKLLSSLGGEVVSQNTYPSMKVAEVKDPDGREICIWQSL